MKVITYSRTYPVKHPRKGQETYFIQKVLLSLIYTGEISMSKACEIGRELNLEGFRQIDELRTYDIEPKHHTIRVGTRWNVGEYFSPRVWSGKPYASKQIEFAPPIQIKKIWNFQAVGELFYLNGKQFDVTSSDLPLNDGLSTDDFLAWFDIHPKANERHFSGQVLCWNENVNY